VVAIKKMPIHKGKFEIMGSLSVDDILDSNIKIFKIKIRPCIYIRRYLGL